MASIIFVVVVIDISVVVQLITVAVCILFVAKNRNGHCSNKFEATIMEMSSILKTVVDATSATVMTTFVADPNLRSAFPKCNVANNLKV